MSYRPLELVIQSAQGLKYVNHFKKMKPYAVVSIRDHNNILHSSERKTSVDSEGGSNPTWNFNVKFTINLAIAQENHLDLVVKLKSRRKTHGLRDKDIGEVRVLISELLKCFGDDHDDAAEDEKHMSKNVVTSDGEAQGALAFSYKFGRTVDHPPHDPNVKRKPKGGANGFTRAFVEGLGEGIGSGLMGAVGMAFFQSDNDNEQPEDEKHMSKNVVTSDGEAQGALAFSYKFGRTVDHPPHDPNVKRKPKGGANGFTRAFVEGLGEGIGSGLMGAVGMAFFQSDNDNEQPDDDNEDEYS